jgi:hypothetical protein
LPSFWKYRTSIGYVPGGGPCARCLGQGSRALHLDDDDTADRHAGPAVGAEMELVRARGTRTG